MMILLAEKIRKLLFWIIDFLKGGKVSGHYKEIVKIIKSYPASKDIAEQKLASILLHAAKTTPFYFKYKDAPIGQFPVINKSIIRENEDSFICSTFDKSKLLQVVTSGSTGTPFCVYHHPEKKIRNTADTIYFAKQAGFEIGNKLYFFKIWNDINKKTKFDTWAQNIKACNVFELSDIAIEEL